MSLYDTLMDYQRQLNDVRTQLNNTARVDRSQTFGKNGWLEIFDGLWTYASATTITVPTGAASIYAVGDQIRLKQGGAYKYCSVTTVADALLTVTGGTDYTVANAAITDAAFSKGGGVGHPVWYNYTSITWTCTTSGTIVFTTTQCRFSVVGRKLTIVGTFVYSSRSSPVGRLTLTKSSLPVAPANLTSKYMIVGNFKYNDFGGSNDCTGMFIAQSGTDLEMYIDGINNGYVNSAWFAASDGVFVKLEYEI